MTYRETVYERARGRCQCTAVSCPHHQGRCNTDLRNDWHIHHLTAGGLDVLGGAIALCRTCHDLTPTTASVTEAVASAAN